MTTTVGDVVALFLEKIGVRTGFGIISVHNIPIFDAIARRERLRIVMTRGEAGASHMADAHARVTGELGLLISSTGPGVANAITGLVEARFAGTPLLHLTGQVASRFIDRNTGTTHDMPDQLGLMRAACKSAYRIRTADEAWGVLTRAATDALTAPMGPVSVEIPIDVQKTEARLPLQAGVFRLPIPEPIAPADADLDLLVERVLHARRPMLWVGNGARHAFAEVRELMTLGFGMVSSWAGRGIVPEDHPMNLGGLNGTGVQTLQDFYRTVDLMLVIGSRLRGQETVDNGIPLPDNRIQIDIDPAANGRSYDNSMFVHGDSRLVVSRMVERLKGRMQPERGFADEFQAMKRRAREEFKATLGPYATFAEQLRAELPRDALWVRDITVANSTWGNRLFEVYGPRDAIHPVGAGIGQGLPLGVGAAIAAGARKTVVLHGDAGFMMNVSELWTAAQEKLDMLFIVMNDGGYGVIRHMQDAAFGGRRVYGDLLPPDFGLLAQAASARYGCVKSVEAFGPAVRKLLASPGIGILEVDMQAVGEAPPYFPYDKRR
ncbi:MAG TPA: thiamine pyrophosphate-binding protein [Burkholderiaceae bacterium]|nr:thiamine pyrophosphate-binding protein [Burkholderiaceae bacterium]